MDMMEDYQAQLIKQIVKDSEVIYKIRQRQPSPKLYINYDKWHYENTMKIIKLDKRYKMYRDGYTHAVRWDCWEREEINRYTSAMRELYGENWYDKNSPWQIKFGTKSKSAEYTPYYLYVKSESMLTMLMLKVNTPV